MFIVAYRDNRARQGRARQGRARQGGAGLGSARHGVAGRGMAWHGRARQGEDVAQCRIIKIDRRAHGKEILDQINIVNKKPEYYGEVQG